jgi:hypothetical protein
LLMGIALTDKRTGLSFVRFTVNSNKSIVNMHTLFTVYMYKCIIHCRILSRFGVTIDRVLTGN